MSSGARSFPQRGSRGRKTSAASVLETRSRRKRRATAARRRSTAVRPSRAAAPLPHPRLGWYVGVAVMAAIEIIEWPLAIMMMLGHEIAHRAHSKALRDFAEGVEAGA
jgi:hypothetical protein